MSLPLNSPNKPLDGALAFEDVATQLFVEALPSGETTQPFTESFVESGKPTLAKEELAPKDPSSQLLPEALPSGETTQPFTESFIESGKPTLAKEEPAPKHLPSQLPSGEAIQPLAGPHPVPKKPINAEKEPSKLFAQAPPSAQPANDSFILPEEERHSKKDTTPEETTQPFTQPCVATEETNLAREEPTTEELIFRQFAEASSPEAESQPFSPPYVLLTDSTDTPEAIASIKATMRDMEKRKEAKCAEPTPVPSKLFKYGYTAETIESETKGDIAAVLEYTHSRVPNARLIVSHRSTYTKGEEMSSSSAIIRPKQPFSGRDAFGVIQRTQDVDFTINMLRDKSLCGLNCQITYKPDSDNCVLDNHTDQEIRLVGLNPTDPWKDYIPKGQNRSIMPGTLGVSLSDPETPQADDCAYIVEIMLLKRQFNISVTKSDDHTPHKRGIVNIGEETKSTKRQKLKRGEAEINSCSQSYSTATSDSIISRSHYGYAARILDLADGETATISSRRPDGVKSIVPFVKSSYQLRRHNGVDQTRSSEVFTAWHSEIRKDLVAKILRYQDNKHLISIAKAWKREKTALERLIHPNIVRLMAFDGRILGLYLEHLPKSLFCGTRSTFQPLDAHEILYGVSSALEYLATKQIEHNDIKPLNIAYCRDRGAVLFDFGAATSPLFKGPVGGTSWYMPPEFLGTWARGAPGDIWALGITMLYVIGKIEHPDRPSNNWSLIDLYRQKESAHRKALAWLRFVSNQRAKLDQMDNVESLVYRMLQKEPTSRIDAAAIVAELKSHVSEPIDPKQ